MTQIERNDLQEIDKKIDTLIEITTRFDERMKSLTDCKDDHERRIRAMETKPSRRADAAFMSAISAIIGAVIGGIVSMFIKK